MTALPRRAGIASAATLTGIVLVVSLVHAAPEWARRVGLDVWTAQADRVALRAADARGGELTAHKDRLFREIEASEHVVVLLINGQLSLPAAVETLTAINRNRAGFADALACLHPDASTPRGRIARYAIDKARCRLKDDPGRLAEVSARLEAEYRRMAAHPTLNLQ